MKWGLASPAEGIPPQLTGPRQETQVPKPWLQNHSGSEHSPPQESGAARAGERSGSSSRGRGPKGLRRKRGRPSGP